MLAVVAVEPTIQAELLERAVLAVVEMEVQTLL
jgi:hypothetical protein